MTTTDAMHTSTATSRDGTEIAYVTGGVGPPLVLVHGVLGDHSRWEALRPYLEPHASVHAMDRRGRGASGDGPSYDVEREFEDVAAVVDAVAEEHGTSVDVYGHSGGASYALSAATLTSNIRRLMLYEPATDPKRLLPTGCLDRLNELLAAGDAEAVVETFCREVLHMPEDQLGFYREQPSWPARVAAAHTLPREVGTPGEQLCDLDRVATVTVPTLLLEGEETPPGFKAGIEAVAAALPDARTGMLEGQAHTADVVAPEQIAEQLLRFLDRSG